MRSAITVVSLLLSAILSAQTTLELTRANPAARAGKISLQQTEKGLLISGEVDGPAPDFPSNVAELMRKDHVEIWLSVTPQPGMPAIGWGNQFGEVSCSDPDFTGDKAQCPGWEKLQRSYRAQLTRLFARQWQLAPKVGAETFADPAFRQLATEIVPQGHLAASYVGKVEWAEPLKPSNEAPELVVHPAESGYRFETMIPWKLFPPSGVAAIQDVYVLVEVFSPAEGPARNGPYSTTSPGRRYGDFATFKRVHLEHAREYSIGACHGALRYTSPVSYLPGGGTEYFFPNESGMISDVFRLENYLAGYAYDPSGFSPTVDSTHLYSKKIGDDEYICGPALVHFKNGQAEYLKVPRDDGKNNAEDPIVIEEKYFSMRALPNGVWLIRDGPEDTVRNPFFGSGQGGADPAIDLGIFSMRPDSRMTLAIAINIVMDGSETDGMDIQVSSDWRRVTSYLHDVAANTWRDQTFCLNASGRKYVECGPVFHRPPPGKRAR